METRIARLESDMEHIKSRIVDIRTDIRDIREATYDKTLRTMDTKFDAVNNINSKRFMHNSFDEQARLFVDMNDIFQKIDKRFDEQTKWFIAVIVSIFIATLTINLGLK